MYMSILDRPVGQLVAEKPTRSRVFERWGIDYCCSGKKALHEACAAKNLDPAAVLQDLEESDAGRQPVGIDWTKETLTTLCDHIENVHHGYLRLALPRLTMLTEKVAERHGQRDPRLPQISDVFKAFRAEMEAHTAKEERVLFPAIRSLEGPGEATQFARQISQPIQVMLADHDKAGAALEKMSALTGGIKIPGLM